MPVTFSHTPAAALFTTVRTLAALKPGFRHTQPKPPGSGDAWLLADLARTAKLPLVILTADPFQAQRLANEISLAVSTLRVHQLHDWETLPYDALSPHQDLISERLRTLSVLMHKKFDVLTLPVTTALYRLPPPTFLAAYTFAFCKGDWLDEASLRAQLTLANYSHVMHVTAPGEFCLRGGLIDLFPMGSAVPYRIDLFDNEIESIRAFDVNTQRSLHPVNDVQLLPGREFPMNEEARTLFRTKFRETFEGDPSRALPYRDIGNGIAFAGIEYYLPLFFEAMATLFDYLPAQSIVVTIGDIDSAAKRFSEDTNGRYQFLKTDRERPVLPPENLFLATDDLFIQFKQFGRLALTTGDIHPDFSLLPSVAILRRSDDPLAKLRAVIERGDLRLLILADSAGRRETLLQLMLKHQITPDAYPSTIEEFIAGSGWIGLAIAPLISGFTLVDAGVAFITENDLFPEQASTTRRTRRAQESQSNIESMLRDLSELRTGDPVVHAQHGIGRYQGLVNLDMGEGEMEFLHLEYANNNVLYVPVSQLHAIGSYSGANPETAPLHQLGTEQWNKARRKAAKQVRDTAAELLELYTRRAARQGFSFKLPINDYEAFAEGFGFEETVDQASAIGSVLQDMASNQPMDRLVCGDVGFGKTEVALRASFLAVSNSKQVALLCPTTLLAEQHTQTFINRFANLPVRVAEMSRFRSIKEISASIASIKDGTTDIIIGTHKILSKDVVFKRLGLIIIDEEHRFGVRQKEILKSLRAEVDVLTLTATPIPRTLGMSLEGIRDFSIIATAPQKRLAIKTFMRREDSSTIREALLRELKRGGQVYFLHNEVETIHNRRAQLEELMPEARIAVAHGQMGERDLEQVMKGFYQQKFNVLLCTTIIETGIDVPTANTIVMHRADRLGLAQLHQLRGRVGRSHHQAYAYLLIPGEDVITSNAKKRLEAIQAMEELGSGFFLAMHDLEIRGTGEILGDSQSGNIQEIGFSMYSEMLNVAVRDLKSGQETDLNAPIQPACEVNIHAPALLPSNYCPDVHVRLFMYKRLSHVVDEDALILTQEELIDRFGKLPEPAQTLIAIHRLRLLATRLGIIKIDASETQVLIQFGQKPTVDPLHIIEFVQKQQYIKFAGQDRLHCEIQGNQIQKRTDAVHNLLCALALPSLTTA